MWFLQKVKRPSVLSYSSKKVHMHELEFCQNPPKNLIFELFEFFGLRDPFKLFKESASTTYLPIKLSNFMQKSRKNWWAVTEILHIKWKKTKMDRRTNRTIEPNSLGTFTNTSVQKILIFYRSFMCKQLVKPLNNPFKKPSKQKKKRLQTQ